MRSEDDDLELVAVGDIDAPLVGLQVDEEQVLSNASVQEMQQGPLPQESTNSPDLPTAEVESPLNRQPPTKQHKVLDNSNTLEAANSLPVP